MDKKTTKKQKGFKQLLTLEFLNCYDEMIDSVHKIEYKKPTMSITTPEHIKTIAMYADRIVDTNTSNMLLLYSAHSQMVKEGESAGEENILETAIDDLEAQKLSFETNLKKCYKALKKTAGRLYEDDAIKEALVVNSAIRLECAKSNFPSLVKDIKVEKTSNIYDVEVEIE